MEAGLPEARGERRSRTYHLAAAAYRRLDAKATYVRQYGFGPLQRDQMILQYVQAHGRITWREVADLCQIGPYQATRLLKQLVANRKLTRRGTGKATGYVAWR